MPAATLRVWQRLYSADDVRRLALMKQLTDLGHAIGSLAQLNMVQLQQVATTHASVLAARATEDLAQAPPSPTHPWRVAVIGTPEQVALAETVFHAPDDSPGTP